MNVHVEVAPQALWHIPIPGTNYEFPITNSFFMMLIVMVLLIAIGMWVARRATLVPTRGQGAVELIVEFLLGLVEGAAGKRLGRSIFPVIGGLFIFILFANYVELLPGLGSIYLVHHVAGGEAEHLPIIRPPTSDLNMTIAMALLSYVMFQYLGIKAHGFKGRIKHLATPVFVFPIEVISETARIISLSFRLFGNIFAGDVLLTIMYSIAAAIKVTVIGFLIPVVFLYLEVLFGFIQALVFAILTLIYISLAAAEVHDDHVEESFEQESGVRAHHAVEASASGD
jgi:F-type H+-transporting ATPase subunit a